MAVNSTFSDRAYSIVRTFRATFAALADHKSESERAAIIEIVASHLRSSAPLALLGAADMIDPAREALVVALDGARIELSISDDGKLILYVIDAAGADAAALLSQKLAGQLRAELARVMASGGVM